MCLRAYSPVSLEGTEAADGHFASPALLIGRTATHFTEHNELCERIAKDSRRCQLFQQNVLSSMCLSKN